jgi:hypothetical protein
MQTTSTSDQITYGIQLWKLNCLYWDGHNYRWARHHRAVAPELQGKIAVAVNRPLKHCFAGPDEVSEAGRREGKPHRMSPSSLNDLQALLPRNATVSTFVVNETRTGNACRLLVFAVLQGEIVLVTKAVAAALALELYHAQLIFPASRENAGACLVAQLGRALHGDDAAFGHQSIGEGK